MNSIDTSDLMPSLVLDTSKLENLLQEMNTRMVMVESKVMSIIKGEIQMIGVPGSTSTEADETLDKEVDEEEKEVEHINFEECIDDTERTEALYQMTQHLRKKIKKMVKDQLTAAAIQKSKDDAQDEVFKMEMDRIHRAIKTRLGHQELVTIQKVMESKLTTLEVTLKSELAERTHDIERGQETEISRIVDQVNNIKQATEEGSSALERRMENGFQEVKKLQKTLFRNGAMAGGGRGSMQVEGGGEDGGGGGGGLGGRAARFQKLELEVSNLTEALRTVEVDTRQSLGQQSTCTELVGSLDRTVGKMGAQLQRLKLDIGEQLRKEVDELLYGMNNPEGKVEVIRKRLDQLVDEDFENFRSQVEKKATHTLNQLDKLSANTKENMIELKSGMLTKIETRAKQTEELFEAVQNTVAQQNKKNRAEFSAIHQDIVAVNRQLAEKVEPELLRLEADGKAAHEDLQAFKTSSLAKLEETAGRLREDLAKAGDRAAADRGALQGAREALAALGAAAGDAERRGEERLAGHAAEAGARLAKLAAALEGQQALLEGGLAELRRRARAAEESCGRTERSSVGLAALCRQAEGQVRAIASKSLFWEALQARLQAHLKGFGDRCCELEANSSAAHAFSLSPEAQRYLAGNAQRVAKLVGQRADFETIRQVSTSRHPEDEDWDSKVDQLRQKYRAEFTQGVEAYAAKQHRSGDTVVLDTRRRFLAKLDQAVRLALSKFNKVQPGLTLFGKRSAQVPACMACDRPFTSDPGPGLAGAADPNTLAAAAAGGGGRPRTKHRGGGGGGRASTAGGAPGGDAASLGGWDDLSSVASMESPSRPGSRAPSFADPGEFAGAGGAGVGLSSSSPSPHPLPGSGGGGGGAAAAAAAAREDRFSMTAAGSVASSSDGGGGGGGAPSSLRGSGGGGAGRRAQKFVYRGGFRIPKEGGGGGGAGGRAAPAGKRAGSRSQDEFRLIGGNSGASYAASPAVSRRTSLEAGGREGVGGNRPHTSAGIIGSTGKNKGAGSRRRSQLEGGGAGAPRAASITEEEDEMSGNDDLTLPQYNLPRGTSPQVEGWRVDDDLAKLPVISPF